MSLPTRERLEELRRRAVARIERAGPTETLRFNGNGIQVGELLALLDAALTIRRVQDAGIDVNIERLAGGWYRATVYQGCEYLPPCDDADLLSALRAALDAAEAEGRS